ncbi:sigma-70 family RNA polymerase sigma factor [Allorhodopirellula heiligendammensis]|uniref:ECF RNA polymerase sigma-E factor n=1 Tax=Allorhodopirellula heiligendammensis TaxID=2714739 RepID=A0A5C6C4Y5_9BACT|nr:sigma-70 family RNA polymerase sigma factor [Allorhodopirellula heiligendammensis]TWU19680.1 ECF RNA polymerase sigma-E factor [Allorhodopirellula heiligendammensis]
MVATDSSSAPPLASSPDPTSGSNHAGFASLLAQARAGNRDALGELLQWYANYLTILASTQLDRRLRRRLNPSDIVQEAMMAAHQDFGDFRGTSQGELLCWLRTILIHTLHRSFKRNVTVEKRDIRREVSLDSVSNRLEESAGNLAAILPANSPSPSAPMQARERAVALADQLSELKPHYREVIVLRVLQGLSFDEIAQRMDRNCGAVRMLWLRALESFKNK